MKGLSELVLFAAVITAAWSRTPAGAVGHNLMVRWRGGEPTDVLARFRTGPPPGLEQAIAVALSAPPAEATDGSSRPGISAALHARLSEADAAAIEVMMESMDLETALERHTIGDELRDRAIRRARSAGAANPEQYATHRPYLPAQQAAEVDALIEEIPPMATALSLMWPVSQEARISSPFGYRNHPTLGKRKFHNGVDIAIPTDTPVHAAGGGEVAETAISGRHIVLDHGYGVTTGYFHGDILHVEMGDVVEQGVLIMDSGSTGRVTGPHLHFVLKINDKTIDPALFHISTGQQPAG